MKYTSHGVEHGLHLAVGATAAEEDNVDERHPAVHVARADVVRERLARIDGVGDAQSTVLGGQDGGVVEQDEQDWVDVALIPFSHRLHRPVAGCCGSIRCFA